MTPLILALSKMLMSGIKRGGGGGGGSAQKSTLEKSRDYHRKELLKGGTQTDSPRAKVIENMNDTTVEDPSDMFTRMRAGKYRASK